MFRSAAREPDVYAEDLRVPKQKTAPAVQTHHLAEGFSGRLFSFQPAEREARKQSTTVSAKRIHRDFISIRRAA